MRPTAAVVLALGLGSTPSAAEPDRPFAPQGRSTQPARVMTPQEMDETEAEAWRATTYPFRMIGRAGMSILRTPLIVGETLAGERRVISSDGFFERTDEFRATDTHRDASSSSMSMGRRD